MCKMMFVSAKSIGDLTEMIKIGTVIYGDSNNDGTGYAYVNGEGEIMVEKSEEEAKYFWLKNNKRIISNSVIAHVRLGTNGGVKKENSHPFLSEDREIALCHNGIISNYTETEKELKKEGHKFSSQTDSEILLHSYEKYKNEFIAKLKEAKVSGSVTVLILLKDGTIAVYTNNGSMKVYETDIGIFGFSTDRIFTAKKELKIQDKTIYFFKNGKLIHEVEVGDVAERVFYTNAHSTFARFDSGEKIEKLLVQYLGLDYNSITVQQNPTTTKIKFSAWNKSMNKISSDGKLKLLKADMKKGKAYNELILETEADKFLLTISKINVKLALGIRKILREAEKSEEADEEIIIQNGQVMNGFDNLRGHGYWD